MNSASQGDHSQPKLLRVAIAIGFIAAIVTAGAVSWSTPDGNLVVTLAPAHNSWTNCVRHRFVALPSWRIGVTTRDQAVACWARGAPISHD